MIRLNGQLIAATEAEADLIRQHLPAHIALTRAEPGCVVFDVTQGSAPLVWDVAECFTDQAAFEAHQARTRASPWFAATQGIRRDFRITGT